MSQQGAKAVEPPEEFARRLRRKPRKEAIGHAGSALLLPYLIELMGANSS